MHSGKSIKYKAKQLNHERRTDDRTAHAIAKALHYAMKEGRLCARTQKTFSWINNRPTAAEREDQAKELDPAYPAQKETRTEATKYTILRDMRADKGRISRLKIKVWQVIAQPRAERKKQVGREWYLLMNKIDPR